MSIHVIVRFVLTKHDSNNMCENANIVVSQCCHLLVVGVKEAQMTGLGNSAIHKSVKCDNCQKWQWISSHTQRLDCHPQIGF